MSTPKLDIFINEVKSFEYEITIYDRHEDDSKYLDSNFEPIPLLRLPKYIKTDYERFLTKLQDEALTEILLLDNHKIEKVFYRLNKIEEEFNDHWDSFHTILESLNKTEENFDRDNDYFKIITLLYSKFGILELNTNAYFHNGFNGTLGRITKELERDLHDALIIKDGLLHQLIHFTKEYLSSIQPAPAEPKVLAVEEQKPAPAVQKGFDLGLTEKQLKEIYQQLNNSFLKGTEIDFVNAFSGKQIINKLEWIDQAQKVKFVTIQTLFQLLSSCNIELHNENNVIKKEVKDALNAIFSNSWGNISSKYNDFNPLTTERQKTISSMIKALNLNLILLRFKVSFVYFFSSTFDL